MRRQFLRRNARPGRARKEQPRTEGDQACSEFAGSLSVLRLPRKEQARTEGAQPSSKFAGPL